MSLISGLGSAAVMIGVFYIGHLLLDREDKKEEELEEFLDSLFDRIDFTFIKCEKYKSFIIKKLSMSDVVKFNEVLKGTKTGYVFKKNKWKINSVEDLFDFLCAYYHKKDVYNDNNKFSTYFEDFRKYN